MNYGIYQGRGCDKFSGVRRPDSFLPKTAEGLMITHQVRSSSIGKESDIVVNGEYSLTF